MTILHAMVLVTEECGGLTVVPVVVATCQRRQKEGRGRSVSQGNKEAGRVSLSIIFIIKH